jgi:hypothetical protein
MYTISTDWTMACPRSLVPLIETQTEVQQELNLEESIPIERHQRLGGMLNYYQRAA